MAGARIPHLKTLWVKDRSVAGATPDSSPGSSSGAGESNPGGTSAHNSLSGLQGGQADEYYHLTSAEHGRIPSATLGSAAYEDADAFQPADPILDELAGLADAAGVLTNDGAGNLSWGEGGGGSGGTGYEALTFDEYVAALLPAAWYSADYGVEEATDDAAENGDAVARWKDRSGNGWHLTQSNSSYQPTFQTNVLGGKPCVRFDGSNDHLFNSSGPTGNDIANMTVFLIVRATGTGNYGRFFVVGINGSGEDYASTDKIVIETGYATGSSPYFRVNCGTAGECEAFLQAGGGLRPTPWGKYVVRMNARFLEVSKDGGGKSTDTSSTVTGGQNGVLMGCGYHSGAITPTTDVMQGDICEAIYFKRVVSDWEIGLLLEKGSIKYAGAV